MTTRYRILALALALLGSGPALAESKVSLIDRPVPRLNDLPQDVYGDMVRYGHQLTTRTFAYIGPEVADQKMRYAGNNLACSSCHQDAGAKPFAMPWVGVTAVFPQYRGREDELSTVQDRINGCMERSMAGRPLPYESREMKALLSYMHFLSAEVPIGAKLEGGGTKTSKPPARRANLVAGEAVYKEKCVACHGEDGLGKRNGVKGDAQGYLFPPVWGPDSFNTGAGMNRILMAMRFIKHNMPQGANHSATVLSDDEAFDVAGYIVSKPRPEKGNLEKDFPARWNKPIDAAFPPYVDDAPADQHKYGPFPPLAEKARALAAAHEARKAQAAAK